MKKLSANFNSSLDSLIRGAPDGVLREVLVEDHGYTGNKEQRIIRAAVKFSEKECEGVYFSVKVPMGSRPKRIEWVVVGNNAIDFFKLSASPKIEQDALEIAQVVNFCSARGLGKAMRANVCALMSDHELGCLKEFAARNSIAIEFHRYLI